MVRIRVIKKSQLVSGALAALLVAALLVGACIAWRHGVFGGSSPGSMLNARLIENSLSADASADRAGSLPSTDAGASLNVSAPGTEPEGGAIYVINLDLSGAPPEITPAPDAQSGDGGISQEGAASLASILAAGLTGVDDGFTGTSAAVGTLSGRSVLIYHTHTHEAYEKQPGDSYTEISAYRTGDADHSIVRVGAELKRLLEGMGASVYHDTSDYEQDELSTSYERSLKSLEQLKREGRTFDLWIDMHRDAYSSEGSGNPFCADINGTETARLMVLLGTGEGTSGGEAFDRRPDFERNLIWGQRITDGLNRIAPGICRPIMIKSGRYNQHISERSLLIEVGHNRNTLGQALASMPYLAQAIAGALM